jgi:hypothetical protein
MASVPGMTYEGTYSPEETFVFPSYRNIGSPHITTLSLPGLTIGLLVWFFSTQVIPNAVSVSVLRTPPQEHQPHVDPSPSSPSSLARSSFVSSSSLSENYEASNPVDKKNKKKKSKQGSKLPTTVGRVGKKPIIVDHVGSVDDVKITQTTHKPRYPCRICKGIHLLKDFPGLSMVTEAWSTHPFQPVLSASEQHVDDPPLTS